MLIKGVAPGDAFLSLHPVHQLKNTSAVGDHGCRAKLGAADILRYAVQGAFEPAENSRLPSPPGGGTSPALSTHRR